uniref:Related to yak1-ser thr protein kinase n=1 Tax=Melanopsichium pennsylvanicum 4 TaxID=1398559 RepID=A0A077R7B6_9BASI|nr:related to yak1-ser thr protein kinase [Melanopsichium pennsylvanicum 4]
MSRHSGAFFGDDVNSLPLHNDPHVGINMPGLDQLGGQHPALASANPYPPSPSSMRSPRSSHGHASSSAKYVHSPNSGTNPAATNYTSPHLHNSQTNAFGLAEPTDASGRYSFDNQLHQQQHVSPQQHQSHRSSTYRNDGLGRSVSMGHSSHPSQSRSASNTVSSGSGMYLSPQGGAPQATGSHSFSSHGSNGSGEISGAYMSSLSPSGMRHSSFISHGGGGAAAGSSVTSPQMLVTSGQSAPRFSDAFQPLQQRK